MVVLLGLMVLAVVIWALDNRRSDSVADYNQRHEPAYGEEWLAMKDSGKSHRFYVVDGINPHYKYSMCGFSTTVDKVRAERGEVVRCKRCLLAKE